MKNTAAKPKQADAEPIKRNVGQILRGHLKYILKLFISLMLQTKGMEHPMKLHFILRENEMTLYKKYFHRLKSFLTALGELGVRLLSGENMTIA